MEKEQKINLIKIIITVIVLIIVKIVEKAGIIQSEVIMTLLYIVPYLIVGFPVLKEAVHGIMNKEPFDECFLMSISTIGAFILGECGEAVFVMLFYQIGEFFGDFAVDRSEKNMKELIDLRPAYANLQIRRPDGVQYDNQTSLDACAGRLDTRTGRPVGDKINDAQRASSTGCLIYRTGRPVGDKENDAQRASSTSQSVGDIISVPVNSVKLGDIIVVKSGERIPLDGEIVEGITMLDTSSLTGESIPRQVKVGDEVLSGTINKETTIKIKVTKKYYESTATKIIELVETASEKKSKSENFITEFARVYTPVVCVLALLVFIVPVIHYIIVSQIEINKDLVNTDDIMIPGLILPEVIRIWLYRALTMLVISCPCALVISIPLAFFSSIGKASKKGILIKGSNFIETIANIKTVVFDKTGTMTKGVFEVVGVHNETDIEQKDIIEKAAYVEFYSNHPIAKCIIKEYAKKVDVDKIKDCKEVGGYGLTAFVNGKKILVGSEKLMSENSIKYKKCEHVGTIVHIAEENKYLGHIVIADKIKDEAKESVDKLKKIGIENTVMLTGDLKNVGEYVANEIGIDKVYAELLPENKIDIVEDLLSKYKGTKNKLAFVGDGINDAATLVRADVGFSMGTIGSDSAIEASDVVLMDDNPNKVYETIKIAKKTMLVNYEIIIFAIGIKIAFLILSALGMANMWFATFADVGVLIICVLNAIRLLI